MALTDKLTAIADAIREKSGKVDTMTLDVMAEEISNLSAEEIITHADIPDYVKEEALEVAKKVQAVRQDDSIVFLAMSDSHYYGDQGSAGVDTYVDANGTQGNVSNLHGAMGAKILTYALDLDFIAHLGDMTWGNKTTTSDLLHSQVTELFSYLSESYKGLPVFCCVGNHDSGIYYHNQQISDGNTGTFTESAEWIYNNFTKHSESDDTVIAGEDCGGYCYRDFADKKLRVFMLNTSEALIKNSSDDCTFGSQRIWFGNALLDLNSKSNASEWSWLLLSHYAADYGGTMPLSELIKAYVEGSSISITDETTNTATTLNFNGNNSAKMIAQFHGHVHNFKTSKLHSYATGSAVQYDAWRMCIPNGQYNRENYYSTIGKYTDIDFSEDISYSKTPNTGEDTSFVVNVINPSEQVIHSICYGAGYDRTIGYGAAVYYSISNQLTNVTTSNAASAMEEGLAYSAELSAAEHCSIQSVSITMGGVDITSSVYSNGVISIPSVTGDVVIVASADIVLACTNQIPISTDADGNIYNSVGYKANTYYNASSGEQTKSGVYLTGYIPAVKGDVIRMSNMSFARNSNCSIVTFDSSKTALTYYGANSAWYYGGSDSYPTGTFATTLDSSGNITQLTLDTASTTAYIRIACPGISKSSITTVNEEIKYADEVENVQAITYALTNVTSSNTSATVSDGDSYTTTITVATGYAIESIIVTMGGVDITSSVYTNGTISISSVTGAVVITVVATLTATYSNQIPISTDTDGSIYGYKAGYRLNSSGVVDSYSGFYITGFIPCTVGDVVRLKNVSLEYTASGSITPSSQRVCFYDSNKNFLTLATGVSLAGVANGVKNDDGIWTQFTPKSTMSSVDCSGMAYFRLSCVYIGDDSIITVNETID